MTGKAAPGEKPTLIRHYADTFNEVDLFDKMLAHIYWPYNSYNKNFIFLVNLILISAINSYTIFSELNSAERVVDLRVPLKQFVEELSKQLLQEK